MSSSLLEHILLASGSPELLAILCEKLQPSELQSLLLEVHRRVADKVTPSRLLSQYAQNRFVAPALADPRRLLAFDTLAFSSLPTGYAPIELSPVAPLGACSVVASVHQNKVVSAGRNTEVVADSTNVLALECAKRRRVLRSQARTRGEAVLLAASHRLLRGQLFKGPRSFAHFRLLTLCAAGRDEGGYRFEFMRLREQLQYYLTLLEKFGEPEHLFRSYRIALTDFTEKGVLAEPIEREIVAPLSACSRSLVCHLDPDRTTGRGYYSDVCFKIYVTNQQGEEVEVGDGGMTSWTQALISDRKERLLISCVSSERISMMNGLRGDGQERSGPTQEELA